MTPRNNKNIIVINGKSYNVGTSWKPKSIDGFGRRVAKGKLAHPLKSLSASKKQIHKKAENLSRPIQKSKILVRSGLKKPHVSRLITASLPAKTKAVAGNAEKRSHAGRSRLISRFSNSATPRKVSKKYAGLSVAKHKIPLGSELSRASAKIAKRSKTRLADFEHAISSASAHLEKTPRNLRSKRLFKTGRRRKIANIVSGTLALLLLAGFFGYQNAPNIEMRLASRRAGFAGNLPSYKPAGYGLAGKVNYQPGKISVSFKSRTDNKSFNITEQASDWSSSSLLAKVVAKDNKPYQQYTQQGKTVYITDSNKATWVDGGVWYLVEGNAELTSDQLLRIAESL